MQAHIYLMVTINWLLVVKTGTCLLELLILKTCYRKCRLYAESENMFYMKEAQLRFEFVRDEKNDPIKLVTYNTNGKDAEWIKEK